MSSLDLMVSYLPEWMRAATDQASNWQRFMNAFALEYDEIKATLDAVSRNCFPGEMDLSEVDWIWRFPAATKPASILADGVPVPEAPSLRKFYGSSSQCYVYDPDDGWVYLRFFSSATTADGVPVTPLPHHVWNVFDELALLAGIRRKHAVETADGWRLETNAELRERFLRRFAWVPGPTREGLLNLAATELGLVKEVDWEAGSDSVELSDPPPLPHSIRIAEPNFRVSGFAQPGQWDGSRLNARITYFPRPDLEIIMTGVVENDDGALVLESGATHGQILIPATVVPALAYWQSFEITGTGSFDVELIDPDSRQMLRRYQDVEPGSPVNILSDQLTHPVAIGLQFYPSPEGESPVLEGFSLAYTHTGCKVSYLYGTNLMTIDSPEFNEGYFNADGSPTQRMRMIVKELLAVVPILWDHFRWDINYWNVVEKDRMGLLTLPGIWDYLPEASRRWIYGIGDLADLAPRAARDRWAIEIHSGFFYLGSGGAEPEEYYLFSDPRTVTATDTDTVTVSDPLISGTPVLVKADGEWLRPVASLQVTEELEVASDGYVYLSYRDTNLSEGDYKVQLPGTSPGQLVPVAYTLNKAFVVQESDDGFTVTTDRVYSDLTVYYEGSKDPYGQTLNIDPAEVPRDGGFIYLREGEGALDDIEITADPEYLVADGHSYAIITADFYDKDNCPVTPPDHIVPTINGEAKDGTIMDDPGELTLVSTVEHRRVYRYQAPDLSGSEVEYCTITVRFGENETIDLTILEP